MLPLCCGRRLQLLELLSPDSATILFLINVNLERGGGSELESLLGTVARVTLSRPSVLGTTGLVLVRISLTLFCLVLARAQENCGRLLPKNIPLAYAVSLPPSLLIVVTVLGLTKNLKYAAFSQ